ncbi:hypothetical protein NKH57_29465 [Mesorhizobium sp. M1050]|nr:hypothetical protein [Mesorhizobium sp. LNHC252B00]ESY64086.1 hypothetical protein X743_31785 [Mesorhizobium sp. LNHC252B00]
MTAGQVLRELGRRDEATGPGPRWPLVDIENDVLGNTWRLPWPEFL